MRELEVTKQYLMLDPNKWLSECKDIVLLPELIGVFGLFHCGEEGEQKGLQRMRCELLCL